MNLVKLFMVVFVVLCINQTYSQIAGFMGKRFTIEINSGLSISNAYNQANFTYKETNNAILKRVITIHPEINLNYTISKRVDMGIDMGYHKFKSNCYDYNSFEYNDITLLTYNALLQPNNYGSSLFFYPISTLNTTIAVNFDFYFRFYSKRHIAPVGVYHQIGFGMTRFGFKDNEIEGYFTNTNFESNSATDKRDQFINSIKNTSEPYTKVLSKFNVPRFSYRIGKKIVGANGLYLNLSADLNITIKRGISKKRLSNLNRTYVGTSYSYNYGDAYSNATYIGRSQLIELKIGIGKTF